MGGGQECKEQGSSEQTTEDTSNKAWWRASEINNEERGDRKHVRQINIEKECKIQKSVGVGGVRDRGRGQGRRGRPRSKHDGGEGVPRRSQPAAGGEGRDDPLAVGDAGAGHNTLGRIDPSNALDKSPAVLVLLDQAHGVADLDGQLVLQTRGERADDVHEARHGVLLVDRLHLCKVGRLVLCERGRSCRARERHRGRKLGRGRFRRRDLAREGVQLLMRRGCGGRRGERRVVRR